MVKSKIKVEVQKAGSTKPPSNSFFIEYLCCEALRGKSAEITGLLERTLTPRRPDRFYPRPKITGNRLSAMYVSAR
jgi:hypothetical protein